MTRRPPTSTLFPYTTLFRSLPKVQRELRSRRPPAYDNVRVRSRIAQSVLDDLAAAWSTLDRDRKSTRLNSSHQIISYAVFCLKKKKQHSRGGPTTTRSKPHH